MPHREATAELVAEMLELRPHPEGGLFRETFRDQQTHAGRSVGTAIYYLLRRGETSRWHRIDASEIWHWYAGAQVTLSQKQDNAGEEIRRVLGPNLANGERPQIVMPRGIWQSARSQGSWSLVGCTVAPGFEFEHFELAKER